MHIVIGREFSLSIESTSYFLLHMGEMHDLLAWKRLASLIKFLRIDFMDLLYYLKDLKMLYLDL